MGSGLQAWHSSTGAKTLDVTDRLTRVLGYKYFPWTSRSYDTIPSGYNGSTTHSLLTNGSPFYFFAPGSIAQRFYDGWPPPVPQVSFSGDRISWTWDVGALNAWQSSSGSFGGGSNVGDLYLYFGVY